MKYLTIALAKGRLAKQTLALLEQTGITCEEMKDKDTRKLIFVNEELGLKFFPFQDFGCAYICRIRRRGYRSGGKRYHSGRGS